MEYNRVRSIRLIPTKIRTEKRVAIYCRVSTNRDSQEESLATQKSKLQQVVKNTLGWTLYRVYEDQDSGKDMFRPGFQSMMCDAFDKSFDIILVKSMSRFSRNSIKALEKAKELRLLGIELRAEDDNISTQENEKDFEMTLRAAIAQAESES